MGNNEIVPGFDEYTCNSLVIELQKVEGGDNCLALKLKGQIDTYSSVYFQKNVKMAIDAGFINLAFLLNSVDYVSSTGVGALLQLQKAVREKGGDIAMVDIHPKVREIFKLMCLEKFFSCADSLDEAVSPMKGKEKVLAFPKAIDCPICEKRLRALKAGRFRCPECKTVLSVDESGRVSMGDG
jgi:anti-anti-sigma factor